MSNFKIQGSPVPPLPTATSSSKYENTFWHVHGSHEHQLLQGF